MIQCHDVQQLCLHILGSWGRGLFRLHFRDVGELREGGEGFERLGSHAFFILFFMLFRRKLVKVQFGFFRGSWGSLLGA